MISTTIPTNFTFLTIAEWLEINPDIKQELEECMTYDGTSEHECEYGNTHECGDCNGTGSAEGETLIIKYITQLRRDAEYLYKYLLRFDEHSANVSRDNIDLVITRLKKEAYRFHPLEKKE